MPTPALLLLAGCLKAGSYALRPQGMDKPEPLVVTARATVDYDNARGSDLTVDLDVTWNGGESARVDLSRALVRADEGTWEPCRHDDLDLDTLVKVLEPARPAAFHVLCRDITRPDGRLDFRFPTSGTGQQGLVELTFEGLRR